MPPKNKNAEEQAKRLQEERKKKEQEQALLELERKKYAPETLDTGLLLPVPSQLIIDLKSKPLQFINSKLNDNLKDPYPTLPQSPTYPFFMKELHYYMKDSVALFGDYEDPQQYVKHRIFISLMFKVLLNEDPTLGGSGKKRENDEKLLKSEVALHCNKKLLTKNEGLKILQYAGERYFGRYMLLTLHKKFPKRQSETRKDIYIQTPSVVKNTALTKFIDLSVKEEEKPQQPKE